MTTRRTTTVAALGGLLTLAGLTLVSAGGATGAPTLHVPDHAVISIDGRGYGHGHGLSQYGAEGAARKGLSAQQIVHFYYPHTDAGKVGGRVRVWISADTDHNTTVVARPGLQVRDLDDGSTTPLPTGGPAGKATRWRLSAGGGASTKVSYLTGTWHTWRTLSGSASAASGSSGRSTSKRCRFMAPLSSTLATNSETTEPRSMRPLSTCRSPASSRAMLSSWSTISVSRSDSEAM